MSELALNFPAARRRLLTIERLGTLGFLLYFYISFVGVLPFQTAEASLFAATGDSDLWRQIFLLFSASLVVPLLVKRDALPSRLLPLLVIVVFCWCGVTLLWSATAGIGFRRLGFTLLTVLVIFVYTRGVGPAHMLRILKGFLGVLTMLSVAAALALPAALQPAIDPGSVQENFWRGLLHHKNDAGLVAAATSIVFFSSFAERRRLGDLAVGALALLLLAMSYAKTSLIILPIAIVLGLLVQALRGSIGRMGVFLLLTVLFLMGVAWFSLQPTLVAQFFDDPTGLTGRAALWSAQLDVVEAEGLLQGAGFASLFGVGTNTPLAPYLEGWVQYATHGHNGYLELLATIGIPGLLLAVVAFLAQPLWWALGLVRQRLWHFELTLLLLFLAFHNLTESSLLDRNKIGWLLLVAVVAALYFAPRPEPATADKK